MTLRAGFALALVLVLAIAASSALLRLSQAGVGCAPWPACQVERAVASNTPSRVEAARVDAPAWTSHVRALHRVSASLAGALFVVLVVLGWSRWRPADRRVGVLLIALAAGLALLGRWTPSALPLVALANLLGGHALLGCAAWLFVATPHAPGPTARGPRAAAFAVLLSFVAAQAALGAMVGVRAAAGACLDGCAWPAWLPPDPRVLDPLLPTALLDAAPASASRRWLLLAHAALGFGLVAIAAAIAWTRRRGAPRSAAWLSLAAALAAALAAVTGVAMSLRPLPLGAAAVHSLAAAATLALVAATWRLRGVAPRG